MSEELLIIMREEIKKSVLEVVPPSIEKFVNGKLDKQHKILERQNETMDEFIKKVNLHNEQHEIDMKRIRPFLEGAAGLKIVRDFLVWIGGGFIAWVAFRNSIKF